MMPRVLEFVMVAAKVIISETICPEKGHERQN